MSNPMGLTLPTRGSAGADVWGDALDADTLLVASHDHTSGKGVQVPSGGIGINADLSFAGFALTNAKGFTFLEQAPASVTSYASMLFASSADHNLYWRNSSGTNVQITAGAQLNLSAVGGIGGDYAAVSALETFTDATHTYGFFQQVGSAVRQYGKLASGDISLFEFKANPAAGVPANAVTLKSPSALGAGYSVTWPTAVPASAGGFLQMDASGVLTAPTSPTLTGTNYIKRGSRTITTAPFIAQLSSVVAGGGVTTPSAGRIGVGCPASSTNLLFAQLTDADLRLTTITSVIVYVSVNGGNVTFTLHMTTSGGNSSAVAGASASTSLLSQYSPITLTPTTPIVCATDLLPGACFGINVACAAGVTCNVQSMEFVTTVT